MKHYDVASPPFLKNMQIKICLDERNPSMVYTAFGMWWHTVTHGRGSEGKTGELSG